MFGGFVYTKMKSSLMEQKPYKIIETNYNLKDFDLIRKDLQNYVFFNQNLDTRKTCTKHKEKNEFKIMADDNKKFFLLFDDQKEALEFLNSDTRQEYGLLETDFQEEIEKITPENIEEKSKEFLVRFNHKFKLNVDYNPSEADIDIINERVKKTSWDKENRFLLNFYMMEVTKRKFNFPKWSFETINTFNPFYIPNYIGRAERGETYYNWLEPQKRKYFNFKFYLGLDTPESR